MLHLEIGDRGLVPGTPVDDVIPAVDQSFFIEPHENLAHGVRKILVHGEVLAVPVHGSAEPLHLIENCPAVLAFPLPNPLEEFLAPHFATLFALFFQLLLDHHLRRDAGMVRPRQPQADESPHAMPAHNNVHLRLVQHVPHVQPAGYIGRRQQQREHRPRLALRRSGNRKQLFPDPVVRPAPFNGGGLVGFGQFVGHRQIQRFLAPGRNAFLLGRRIHTGHISVTQVLKDEPLILQAEENQGQTRPGVRTRREGICTPTVFRQ